jgi:predicted flap endonuclease-1-like 5' DNA nuclease
MTKKVVFKLSSNYVAGATSGILVGEFNHWDNNKGIALTKLEDGTMMAEVELAGGKSYEYRYLLNDGRWVNDDNAKKFVNAYGMTIENCIVEVVADKKEKAAKAPAKKAAPTAKKASEKKPVVVKKEATEQPKQDLTKILGVTAKVAQLFQSEGVATYKDLGRCTMKQILLILETAAIDKKVKHATTWAKQAKMAAANKWEELSAYQAEIKSTK